MNSIRKVVLSAAIVFALMLSACGQGSAAAVLPAPEDGAVPVNTGKNVVSVSTVDEFLTAIAPDTHIVLQSGVYELNLASDYGRGGGEYYRWDEAYDGPELVIHDAGSLSISAADDANVTISALPRYANVMRVVNCDGFKLEDVTCGHTKEPGACAGGVIRIESSDGVRIDDCNLFGCGTVGVDAFRCSELYVTDCDIYECSYNAVAAASCKDVRIIDCDIYDIRCEWANIFEVGQSAGFAVVNCDIENNSARYLLYADNSPEVYILGCDTEENYFNTAVFRVSGKAPVLEGTSLNKNYFTAWYDSSSASGGTPGLRCVDKAGNELSNAQLEQMMQSDCTYDGPNITLDTAAPEITVDESGKKTARVGTADEFLAAIRPGVNIILDADTIDLSAASDYGWGSGEYYFWRECYDGAELVISDADGMSITSDVNSVIAAVPRYANVLNFENCAGLSLSGFTAGHTTEPGECAGGVLAFDGCRNIAVDGCSLYGCGILGIYAAESDGLTVTGTEIYDCSTGAVALYAVKDAVFENCDIHDCPRPEISLYEYGAVFINAEGKTASVEPGNYTMNDEALPISTDAAARVSVLYGGGAVNLLELGKNDAPVQLYAMVELFNGETVDPDRIRWGCAGMGDALDFDSSSGAMVVLTSNLAAGESAELYVDYLGADGCSVGCAVITVTG